MRNVRKEVIQGYKQQINRDGIIVVKDADKKRGLDLLTTKADMTLQQQKSFVHSWLATEYCVGGYGSARLGADTPDYQWGKEVGYRLSKKIGVSFATGGGPNLMAAPLEGAWHAINESKGNGRDRVRGSKRLGFTLGGFLNDQQPNEWLQIVNETDDFGERLGGFLNTNHAAVFNFGGIGTVWELFGFLQAKQSHIGHIEGTFPAEFPIIVHPSMERLLDTFYDIAHTQRILEGKTPVISEVDQNLAIVTDDIGQIEDIIGKHRALWQHHIYSRVRRDRNRNRK